MTIVTPSSSSSSYFSWLSLLMINFLYWENKIWKMRKQTIVTLIDSIFRGLPENSDKWSALVRARRRRTNKQTALTQKWPNLGLVVLSFAKWFEPGRAKRPKEHLKCFRPDMLKRRPCHKRQSRAQLKTDDYKYCCRGRNNAHWGVFARRSRGVIISLWTDNLSHPQSLDTVKAHRQLEVSGLIGNLVWK